jgi:sentrin-specific protease 7
VEAALCQPTFRYNARDGQRLCFLQETALTELRAFEDDGDKAEPYDWLKITAKAKSLAYHPDSVLVKVAQASDQASSIGAVMYLKLRSNIEASGIVNWAHEALRIHVVQVESKYCAPRIALLSDHADGT